MEAKIFAGIRPKEKNYIHIDTNYIQKFSKINKQTFFGAHCLVVVQVDDDHQQYEHQHEHRTPHDRHCDVIAILAVHVIIESCENFSRCEGMA